MQPLHGLARFPVLKATLKYGRFSAFGLGVLVAGLVLWSGWPSFGLFSPVLAAGAGALTAVAVLSYVELIRLITELLMPD
jgi:fumarate reductase flavoprotein subunit